MYIEELLTEKKRVIVRKWFDLTIETYPEETRNFLKTPAEQSANPVAETIHSALQGLFNGIINKETTGTGVASYLDNVVRIRAIQDFTPTQAVGFIFGLKDVIREELMNDVRRHGMYEELMAVESGIDRMAAAAFDIYMRCREKIYDLRANEVRNWTYRILKQSNMLREHEGEGI